MKRILIITALLCSSLFIKAQELGVRFGDVSAGNDVAVDAVFSMAEFSRVHADLSFGTNVGIDALYDFIYRPLGSTEGFYYYIGLGPFIQFGDPFFFGATGEIGLEYRFDGVPIVLGADWRPYLPIVEDFDFYAGGFGVNVRWNFGAK